MILLLSWLWVVFYILIFIFACHTHNIWLIWAWNSVLFSFWAGYDMFNGNTGATVLELIFAALNALVAWFSWKNDNRRNRKKFRLGALGYKARAARDRLVAAMPQGRKPGLNPT